MLAKVTGRREKLGVKTTDGDKERRRNNERRRRDDGSFQLNTNFIINAGNKEMPAPKHLTFFSIFPPFFLFFYSSAQSEDQILKMTALLSAVSQGGSGAEEEAEPCQQPSVTVHQKQSETSERKVIVIKLQGPAELRGPDVAMHTKQSQSMKLLRVGGGVGSDEEDENIRICPRTNGLFCVCHFTQLKFVIQHG